MTDTDDVMLFGHRKLKLGVDKQAVAHIITALAFHINTHSLV